MRSSRNSPVSVRPYGGSEPNAMRSAGTRVNSDSMSIVDSHELSNTARGWSRRPSPITAWSATPTWAMISPAPGCLLATSTSSAANVSGRPRPAWIRIGTRASSASAKIGSTWPARPNAWARGCSLIPRAPSPRQRSASATGSSAGSRRQKGIRRPSLPAAQSSTRSLGSRYAGERSGSCRGKTTACCASTWSSISIRPAGSSVIPSSSRPRWVWTSMMWAPPGRRRATSSTIGTSDRSSSA